MQWQTIVFRIAVLAVALYAWRRGGQPERIAATMFLAALVASILVRSPRTAHLVRFEPLLLTVDLALLGGLLWLALRADRRWPLWCVAWHGIAMAGHLAKGAVMPFLLLPVYQVMLSLSSWPTIVLLARGTHRHQQRLRRNGVDPSWSGYSARATPPATSPPR